MGSWQAVNNASLTVIGILIIPRTQRLHHALNLYPFPQLIVAAVAARLDVAKIRSTCVRVRPPPNLAPRTAAQSRHRTAPSGRAPKDRSERLGHHSAGYTLDVYSAVLPSMHRDVVDRLSSFLGK